MAEATPGADDVLVDAWSSTTDGAAHVEGTFPVNPPPEVPRPAGWLFFLRLRCAGDGTVSICVSGKTGYTQTYKCKCSGKWGIGATSFPSSTDTGPYDPGPFRIAVDRPAGVTSWDVEGYAQRVGNLYPEPTASPT